ncbi:MAG: WD40/YVTN/BNR-like repeat-containing protein [Thermoplasmatota archaeon]
MRPQVLAVLAPLVVAVLAGCTTTPAPVTLPGTPVVAGALSFSKTVLVDPTRVASEPSIKVTRAGTLVIAAPTGTVKYATRPLDLPGEADKGAYQSAIWTSRDNGTSWGFASVPPAPYHSTNPGGADADLAVDGAGTIYMADQEALAAEAVSVSHDEGQTWSLGSAVASGEPDVDRMWMWPEPATPGTVYMVFDHNGAEIDVAKTTDGGMTWTATATPAQSTAPGPIVVVNHTVAFGYKSGQSLFFVHSEDKGATWTQDEVKSHGNLAANDLFPQTFADQAGTLYMAWLEDGKVGGKDGTSVAFVASHDAGKTWGAKQVPFTTPGSGAFLWAAAGAAGRLGFSWYESPSGDSGPYFEHAGVAIQGWSAHGNASWSVTDTRVTATPARVDAICNQGVGCTSNRELGDFQTCAIGPDGRLVVAFVIVNGTNAAGQPNGGLVAFAKMTQGPLLMDKAPSPWVV